MAVLSSAQNAGSKRMQSLRYLSFRTSDGADCLRILQINGRFGSLWLFVAYAVYRNAHGGTNVYPLSRFMLMRMALVD